MRLLKQLLHLYKGFAPATIIISLAGTWYAFKFGGDSVSTFIPAKIMVYLLTLVFYQQVQSDKLVYYYNLHISRSKLWLLTFGLDLALYFILLIPALLLHRYQLTAS